MFIYEPNSHWNLIASAHHLWSPGGRGKVVPSDAALNKALKAIDASTQPITRTDMLKHVPASLVRELTERDEASIMAAKRMAAGRTILRLSHLGKVCVAEKICSGQGYVSHANWFPEIPHYELAPKDTAVQLTREYLRVHGPATPLRRCQTRRPQDRTALGTTGGGSID